MRIRQLGYIVFGTEVPAAILLRQSAACAGMGKNMPMPDGPTP